MLTRSFSVGTALMILALTISAHAREPLHVVASFSILGDMTQQVGGDTVSVQTLVGADSDSHGYQPTSADLKAVSKADLLIVNGLGFDDWMQKLAAAAAYKGKIVIASKGVTPHVMSGESEEHAHAGHLDPHAWQDLHNGILYTDNISAALIEAVPSGAIKIAQQTETYKTELRALDATIRAAIAAVPPERRVIITSHDAFGYFGAAYGVQFHAPYGLSTEAEPSASDIAKLVDQIKKVGVKTVFIENMTNPRLISQLGKDADAKLGGTLYADALSSPTADAAHYTAMFKHNLPLLVAAMKENVENH